MIFAGIDAGSRAIKCVLVDESHNVVASGVRDQGIDQEKLARQLFEEVLHSKNLSRSDVRRIIATGYGRTILNFADSTITEITCHAEGVRRGVGEVKTIIDIGGQDSKVIKLDARGRVRDFAMNDRCAAGTGRFLEVVADRLKMKLEELGQFARRSKNPASISSMCVVFAETEIIGLLASGSSPEDIVAGVQRSIATRVAAMAGQRVEDPIVFTGGVALIPGMLDAIKGVFDREISVAPDPQNTGAFGAAILASQE